MKRRKLIFNVLKYFVLVVSFFFLGNKLLKIQYWDELKNSFAVFDCSRVFLLLFVVLLMPLNWSLEVKKWQKLTCKVCSLKFGEALKSVLSGISTGYVTPNRIGEFAGRILYLPKKDKSSGVALSLLNGFTQNLVIMLLGIISTSFYFMQYRSGKESSFLVYFSVILIVAIVLYFTFPHLIIFLKQKKWVKRVKIQELSEALSLFQFKDLLVVLFLTATRFMIFSLQYFLLLFFFGIELSLNEAIISIPTMYFLVTFTPSFTISEPAVRGAYASFVFAVFSDNQIGMILTGVSIWLINFVVPLLVGLFIFVRGKNGLINEKALSE